MTRARGFSVVEVMVAVFVLAVGILGVGGLQLTSKRANLEAVQRSTAAALAQDLVERMRANLDQLGAYTNGGAGWVLTGATTGAVDCSAGCTPDQLALHDLHEFERALAGAAESIGATLTGGLSAPTACISGPDGGSGVYTVAIAWRGLTKLSDPALHACGAGSGQYDAATAGGVEADAYRRLLVVDTFVAEPI